MAELLHWMPLDCTVQVHIMWPVSLYSALTAQLVFVEMTCRHLRREARL